MCQAGVAPTAATFGALLPALQRQHTAQEVGELVVGLAAHADDSLGTPGAALLAALEACRARGWWELSLQLLAAVEAAGGRPTVDQIDRALAACAAGGAIHEVRALP